MTESSLTLRQQRFVKVYLCDLNAARAARSTGYHPEYGRQLVKTPDVALAITEALLAREDARQTLRGTMLDNVAQYNSSRSHEIARCLPDDLLLQRLNELPPELAASMEISITRKNPDGTIVRMKLPGRQATLRDLALAAHHLQPVLNKEEQEDDEEEPEEDYESWTDEQIDAELKRLGVEE